LSKPEASKRSSSLTSFSAMEGGAEAFLKRLTMVANDRWILNRSVNFQEREDLFHEFIKIFAKPSSET
jgi:hypothetical protein